MSFTDTARAEAPRRDLPPPLAPLVVQLNGALVSLEPVGPPEAPAWRFLGDLELPLGARVASVRVSLKVEPFDSETAPRPRPTPGL